MWIIFGPSKTFLKTSKSCGCETLRVLKYLLSICLLYTHPHDPIKAKVLSLVKWCFNGESKTYLCTSNKARFFSSKNYDSYTCAFRPRKQEVTCYSNWPPFVCLQSLCYRIIWWLFCVVTLLFGFSVVIGLRHRTESGVFLFLLFF